MKAFNRRHGKPPMTADLRQIEDDFVTSTGQLAEALARLEADDALTLPLLGEKRRKALLRASEKLTYRRISSSPWISRRSPPFAILPPP